MTDADRAVEPQPARIGKDRRQLPSWRWEELRTTFWVVPSVLVVVSVLLFIVTFQIDVAAYHGHLTLPVWIRTGSADAERQVLIAIAAAVITVIGVVFSITILALTLASQQFGPRMMRNFVRDIGNQVTLGVFVGTFVFAVLSLVSINSLSRTFVPYLSTSVAEALLLVDLGVLIYFIHHIAKSIQLPEVIAGIADDLMRSIEAEYPDVVGSADAAAQPRAGRSVPELLTLMEEDGAVVPSQVSGYIQYVGYAQLISIASRTDSVIRLEHRPGHYLATGRPLAFVWPRKAAPEVALALSRAHVTGPHRTLVQDPVFAIDQLVEIAIRAMSSAVNDTFTTLTCIDWLSAGLSSVSGRVLDEGVYRDSSGKVRLIEFDPSYARMVNRAFDKIRQGAQGMPAVQIRLIDSIGSIVLDTTSPEQRTVLRRQADMVLRLAEKTVTEPDDLEEIRFRYRRIPDEDALGATAWPGGAGG
ncbi:MAG TPA: DUF2254 domain-containing protein [Acidimicrobiales bacterium]|jgi:uncharacterized membrane protein|nr:DUF2254 domain-containing protein [Acidimicrobiales bacterium]